MLVPNDRNVGVSRKIANVKERNRLRRLAKSLRPQGYGLIVRTMAVGKDVQTLRSDLDGLLKVWKRIEESVKNCHAPKLIHKDMEMASSIIRDLFSPGACLWQHQDESCRGHLSFYFLVFISFCPARGCQRHF